MTEKTISKLKRTLIFLLTAVMSISLLFAVACNDKATTSEPDDPTYSKVENDTQELKNGNFEFGTASADLDDYPYTSVTGWTKATDSSAPSSNVNSGIIDTSSEAWDELLVTLSKNTTFLKWAGLEKADEDDEAAQKTLIDSLSEKISNPSTHADAKGTKIYMLNNYNKDNIGKGTAQKVTSSTSFTLEPGSYAKLSVWVNTANLKTSTATSPFANIRVISTVAGVTQNEYAIEGITTTTWQQYSVYVKANNFATTTIKLVLGLGYGNGSSDLTADFNEGTVYFDEAVYTKVEESEFISASAETISLVSSTSSERVAFAKTLDNKYYLDLTQEDYFEKFASFNVKTEETKSNTGISNIPADGEIITSGQNSNGFTVDQKRTSTTTTLTSNEFKVAGGNYVMLNFKLGMNVNKLQKSGLTVWLFDVSPENQNTVKEQKVLDNVTVEEDTLYTVVVNNNYVSGERTFYLAFIFGPSDVYTTNDQTAYVTGSYEVKDITLQKGLIEDKEDDVMYSLVNKTSNVSSFALYAGSDSDYSEKEETENYSFSVAPSDKGSIETKPAKVSGYKGIADYGTSEGANADVISGLINSKYVSAYGTEVETALGYDGTDNIQPLMIYNKVATSYGYVKSDALTLAANASATLSVKVKVNTGATAYIYLINTTRGDDYLEPIAQKFTANGTDYNNKLVIKVEDTEGEWVTIKFYVESGKDAINYRLEMWNGERTTENATATASQGYVFFNEVSTGSSFSVNDVITSANKGEIEGFEYINNNITTVEYTQALNENEIKWNDENPDEAISYKSSVVYATDVENRLVLVSLKSINPTENDPYATTEDDTEDTTTKSGCADVDASTLALSLSSLILAVALVAAIIAVVVKAVLRKTKKHKNDAKSHYKVTSRNKTQKAVKAKANAKLDEEVEELDEVEEIEEKKEEYTYGDVLEDFGDDEKKEEVEEVTEEVTEENEEK